MEFYKKHRPTTFKQIVGQNDAIRVLSELQKRDAIPHAILLTGPSGCGKTTVARILKNKLECSDQDFCEINAADARGVEVIRDIRQRMSLSPMNGGKCRVWLLDEVHQLLGPSQSILLKMLEDTPSHVYFMLATTDAGKLLPTIKTRCTEIKLQSLSADCITELVKDIAEKEELELSDEVVFRIVEVADGSARKALVLLDQIAGIEDEEERLSAILSSDSKRQAIELARAMINPRSKWKDVAAIIKGIEGEEPETIRRLVLGYASAVLLNGGVPGRCFHVLSCFESNFFDSGKAGLVRAAYEVCQQS